MLNLSCETEDTKKHVRIDQCCIFLLKCKQFFSAFICLKFVFKMTSFFTYTFCQATSPLINCSVNKMLFQIVPDGYETLPKFISVLNALLVHALFHNGPDGVIDWI